MGQIFANNPSISPTANHAMRVMETACYYSFGVKMYTVPDITWESQHPWDRMLPRHFRMFQSDVELNAPKNRTLFNYRLAKDSNFTNQYFLKDWRRMETTCYVLRFKTRRRDTRIRAFRFHEVLLQTTRQQRIWIRSKSWEWIEGVDEKQWLRNKTNNDLIQKFAWILCFRVC